MSKLREIILDEYHNLNTRLNGGQNEDDAVNHFADKIIERIEGRQDLLTKKYIALIEASEEIFDPEWRQIVPMDKVKEIMEASDE